VDDVFTCFKETARQLNNFLSYINSVHYKTKFTPKKESDNKINFLDRFPTRITISPLTYTISSHLREPRSLTTPSTHFLTKWQHTIRYNTEFSLYFFNADLEKELKIIKCIGIKNKFLMGQIRRLINKKHTTFQLIYPKLKCKENTYIHT